MIRAMVFRPRLRWWAFLLLLGGGCVRQDTEIFARVGHKLGDRARERLALVREKLPFPLPRFGEETLLETVELRLRSDRALQGTKIEVALKAAEVELRGTLTSDEQKRRAVELAESTQGVEKVVDALTVGEKMP